MTDYDPTVASLAKFDDPGEWDKIVPNVPVFVPHRGRVHDVSGKPREVKVDVPRLQKIADIINRKQHRDGVVIRGTEGHTLDPTKVAQKNQPPILTFFRDARVGTWGPDNRPGLLATMYVRKGCFDKVQNLPYRSAEFHEETDELTGVALLSTDPRLDMGMLIYSGPSDPLIYRRSDGTCLYMEIPQMADPTMPPQSDDSDHDFEKFCSYMKRYQEMNGAPGGMPALPSPTNGSMPPVAGDPDEERRRKEEEEKKMAMSQYGGRDSHILQYRKLEGELAEVRRQNEAIRLNYARSESTRLVRQLVDVEGYVIRNEAKEIQKLSALDDAGRAEYVEDIRLNYSRSPVGGPMLDLGPNPDVVGGKDDPEAVVRDGRLVNERKFDEVLTYMRRKGCSYDEARDALTTK